MASCLVPEFPAVLAALQHLKELDRQLALEGVPFGPEASQHLAEITAAITGLEAERRAAHEHLEVETIENSELRHKIHCISDRLTEEILAEVAAVRGSYSEEVRQHREDLSKASRIRDEAIKKLQALGEQNETLHLERQQLKTEHEALVASLNDEITQKFSLQMQLDQIKELTEQVKSHIAAVELDKLKLQQKILLERDTFSAKDENLSREEEELEEKIKHQKQAIKVQRTELKAVTKKKEEANGYVNKLSIQMARLESNLKRLTASRSQSEMLLEEEAQKYQELSQQREVLEKKPGEIEEECALTIQSLQEEIATVEAKIEEGRASRQHLQENLAQIRRVYKQRHGEENNVRAEHSHISQQLEKSKLQLEERIASIVRYSQEIKMMEQQIRELREADAMNRCMLEINQEELRDNMDVEMNSISQLEDEKKQLTRLIEESKRKQEEHVTKMKFDTNNAKRRYEELRQEEAALLKRQPITGDTEVLMSHIKQRETEYREMENIHQQEIQQFSDKAESLMRIIEEKQEALEEKEEALKEVEAKWREEQSRNEGLQTQWLELKRKRTELTVTSEGLAKQIHTLLEPRERLKAELEEHQQDRISMLDRNNRELRAVEVGLYNNNLKLEQVGVENSRLHLAIRQMEEEADSTRQDRERYLQQSQKLIQDIKALKESLQKAWGEDLLHSQHCQRRDGVLLESIGSLLDFLRNRRRQVDDVSSLLHQQMLDFSRRLGDKAMVNDSS